MPIRSQSKPRPISTTSIPEKKREDFEELVAESLPVLCEIDVHARVGTRDGRKKPTGIRFIFEKGDADEDETPMEICDKVCDEISEYAEENGTHFFAVKVYGAGDKDVTAKLLGEVKFPCGTEDHTQLETAAGQSLDLGRHHVKTIRELDNIIVRQGKALENMASGFGIVRDSLASTAEMRRIELEIQRDIERNRQAHEEDLAQQQSIREILQPISQHLGPVIAEYVRDLKKNQGPRGEEDPSEPKHQRLENLLASFDDATTEALKGALGSTWKLVEKAADTDTEEAFTAVVEEVREDITTAKVMAVAKVLTEEQTAQLLDLL